ncbi:MAG: serine/threonine protein kinase [Labilithrix sp.]|nr:serine/threonine protein kinase [Labilithrix sp.]
MGNAAAEAPRIVGRYALYQSIAAGGMATVHLGRLLGPVGFSRTVAIKRLHAQFAADPEFVSMFLDEARLAARIRHPNVVPTLDVVATSGELFLVMDYVPGESVARLARVIREKRQTFPPRVMSAIIAGALHGLHAAHEAKDERGQPLGIVYRDVSPQNVLVGVDGVPRVLDFGVAKAAGRVQTTRDGQIKGKLSYMPPEQLRGGSVTRQSDIYAAGIMLWELLTGQRLFTADNEGALVAKILDGNIETPSRAVARALGPHGAVAEETFRVLEDLEPTVMRALATNQVDRFTTAREMAIEIERRVPPATNSEVSDWLEIVARDVLTSRAAMVAEIESSTSYNISEPSGHVHSVMSGRETLGPDTRGLQAPFTAPPPPVNRIKDTEVRPRPSLAQTMPLAPYGSMAPHSGSSPGFHPLVDGPPVTQPSSISVASGHHPRAPEAADSGTARRVAFAVFAAVMAGVMVVGMAVVWKRSHDARPLAGVEPQTGAAETTAAAGSTPAGGPGAGAAAEPAVDAAAAAVPVAAGTGTDGARDEVDASVAKKKVVVPKPAGGGECANPSWFDAQGVKHYKPQCLGIEHSR